MYVRVSCYWVYLSGSAGSVCQSELLLSVPLWKRWTCMLEWVVIGCTSLEVLEVYVRVSCYRVYLSGSIGSVC